MRRASQASEDESAWLQGAAGSDGLYRGAAPDRGGKTEVTVGPGEAEEEGRR